MLQTYRYTQGELVMDSNSPDLFVYISPTDEEMRELLEGRGLDRHNLESAIDPEELGRVELANDHIFIVCKRPLNYSSNNNYLFRISSAGLFLHADRIILIVPERVDFSDFSTTKPYHDIMGLLLRFLLNATNHFHEHLKVMAMVIQSIEVRMAENLTGARVDSDKIINIYSMEKSLIYYANGIGSNQIVLEKLKNFATRLNLNAELSDFLDDIIIENNQCAKLTETLSKIVQALSRTRETIVNNKLNTVMKRLTIITTVFMPLTVITGFFGMSEFTQMAGGINWWFVSYPLFVLLLVLTGIMTYRYFKKRGWT